MANQTWTAQGENGPHFQHAAGHLPTQSISLRAVRAQGRQLAGPSPVEQERRKTSHPSKNKAKESSSKGHINIFTILST